MLSLFIAFILVFAATLGGVLMSVCGFGMGAVSMSILPHFLPYHESVALAGMCGCCTSLAIGVPNYKHINWRIMLPCAFFGICASYGAVMLSANVRGGIMVKALGVALIALSVYSIFLGGKLHVRPTLLNGSIAGILGGVGSGLFAVGGPPIAVYMLAAIDDKDVYRATTCMHFFFTTIIANLTRWHQGIITMEVVHMWLVMLVGMTLGIYLGNKIFHRLNAQKLKIVVYAYLAVSGITLLFK